MSDNKSMITKIAWDYYINNRTQQEIADKMNLSRIKVTRFLQKARDMGIVKITVFLDHNYCFDKEEELKRILKIDDVIIVPASDNEEETAVSLGVAGATRLNQLVTADDILGVAWGKNLYYLAKELNPVKRKNGKQIEVVQLMGGLTISDRVNPEEIVKMIATRLDARGNWMNMPALVGSKEARDILMNDATVAQIFNKAKECSICLTGLGDLSVNSSIFLTGTYKKEDLDLLVEAGAVGEMISRPYDLDGNPVEIPLTDRIIAVALDQIKPIKKRIAVASGKSKVKAIIGAARGGYLNELITDEITADEIINYFKQ